MFDMIITYIIFFELSSVLFVNGDAVMHGKMTRNIKNYQLAVPHRATPEGEFDTFHVNYHHQYDTNEFNNRFKRQLDDPHSLHYGVLIDDELHHLEVWPNRHLLHPRAAIERYNGSKFRGTNKIRSPHDLKMCYYQGRIRGIKDSAVHLSTCHGLLGQISFNNKTYFIEPVMGHTPNSDGHHLHVIHDGADEKLNKKFCGSKSHVKRHGYDEIKASLKELYQKKGFSVLKRSAKGKEEDAASKIKDASIRQWQEIMLVLDQFAMDKYQANLDVEVFGLQLINGINQIMHDASMPATIDLVLVRMIFLDKNEDTFKIANSNDVDRELVNICGYTNSINPPEEDHPNHHDSAIFVTGLDICRGPAECGVTGLAILGAACTIPMNCQVIESEGMHTAFVAAHEQGHLMSMDHDVYNPPTYPCTITDTYDNSIYVMVPMLTPLIKRYSPCSIASFLTFTKEHYFDCFYDEPSNTDYSEAEASNMMPGQLYSVEQQCFLLIGNVNKTTREGEPCPIKGIIECSRLLCRTAKSCIMARNERPYDGTPCGKQPADNYCLDGVCVPKGTKPNSTDGGWSEWGLWGECSATCGKGIQARERDCNNPRPKNRGRYCLGLRKQYQVCYVMDCPPDEQSRRVQSCKKVFKQRGAIPIRREIKKDYNIQRGIVDKEHPCSNVCAYRIGNRGPFITYFFGLYVPNGIKCKLEDPNYICLDGQCSFAACKGPIGPDNTAVEDFCGVCDGDGTLCKIVEGDYNGISESQWHKLADIPAGARSLKFWNDDPLNGVISIGDPNDNQETAINSPTEFDQSLSAGAYPFFDRYMFYYEQELIENGNKGALITIKVDHVRVDTALYISHIFPLKNLNRKDNVKVFWHYYERDQTAQREPKFKWDFDHYGECSHKCGGGIAEPIIKCFEDVAGKVSNRFCEEKKLEKPTVEAKVCNSDPCHPEWRVGAWGPCRACRKRGGVRTREVQCVKETGRKAGDPILLNDSDCEGMKPGIAQLCFTRKVCGNRKRRRPAMPGKFQDTVWRQMKKIHILQKRLVTPFKQTKTVPTLFAETTTKSTTLFTWTPPPLKDKFIVETEPEKVYQVNELMVIDSNKSDEDALGGVLPVTMEILNGTTRIYVVNAKEERDKKLKKFAERKTKTTKKSN
ncbi:A disintegrin and metalloproteinase with thrombospondin motifs 6-like [Anthonomus grandis grandis]|uniref:A disintegrin and metalloproteinase with thrombospondin motifs 6-like n=1 Tax=Anthonomus grandis grandis TaxID=2921223 RepID=UPI002165966D|nr:A disintegrin and metalloproteinase with thrombospondin motifs 6-like [Anthonomus grandis grandis]